MRAFWVDFDGHSSACVEAPSLTEATTKAREITGSPVKLVRQLPYPALPRIGKQSDCPAFCYRPKECAGRGCCPQRMSCTE